MSTFDQDVKIVLKERAELQTKETALKKYKIDAAHEEMVKRQAEVQRNQSMDFTLYTPEQIEALQQASDDYIELARKSGVFLNSAFKGKVPFFAKNLILVGGKTGVGKSTLCANLIFGAISQKQKVLVITNEENPVDIFNRVTSLIYKVPYRNHQDITQEMQKKYRETMKALSERIMVIDDKFKGSSGLTTTKEGITGIFDNLIANKIHYDVIIIDYYQNIKFSSKNPSLADWQVQDQVGKYLDNFKNVYSAPIVLLSQLKADEKVEFQDRISGRKSIMDSVTCAVEVIKDSENLRTGFKIHKNRFNESSTDLIYNGFDKGLYVPMTPEFAMEVEKYKTEKMMNATLKNRVSENK
jgi:archaellum biogenesis ATPase FlaH